MLNPHPTRFADLNGVLHDLVRGARDVLGASFVGAYVEGSFALGAGDLHRACDVLVVVRESPDHERETGLQALHRALLHRDGHWGRRLEGSYAVAADLRTTAGLGRPWLRVDQGQVTWSERGNQPWTRWILREHGITLLGPCPRELVEAVPVEVLREHALAGLATITEGVETPRRDLVAQAARSLFTVRTGEVASTRDALRWALVHEDPRWRPLLQRVLADRDGGWDDRDGETPPGSLEAARAFAAHVGDVA